MDIHIYNNTFLRQTCDLNSSSKFDEGLFLDTYLRRLRLKQGREIHDYVLRQGVPEGRSSERYATQTSQALALA